MDVAPLHALTVDPNITPPLRSFFIKGVQQLLTYLTSAQGSGIWGGRPGGTPQSIEVSTLSLGSTSAHMTITPMIVAT